MATVDDAVAAYIRLRDKQDEIKRRHSEELAPIRDKMYSIEVMLLKILNSTGGESIKTAAGTAFKSKRTKTKVVDWDAALDFILTNGLEHMLERRVSKAAVEEFIEANGDTPPGVSLSTEITVNIRRS